MYGYYSRVVSNQERVMVARVRYFNYISIKICRNFNECWLNFMVCKHCKLQYHIVLPRFPFMFLVFAPLLVYYGFKIFPPCSFIPSCSINYFGKNTLLLAHSIMCVYQIDESTNSCKHELISGFLRVRVTLGFLIPTDFKAPFYNNNGKYEPVPSFLYFSPLL